MNDPGAPEEEVFHQAPVATTLGQEILATARLALPIIFGQLLQNSLGVIDTIMVGHVSVGAVAAASLATALFVVPLVFGFGVMGPFSVFVAQAAARGKAGETVDHLRRGLALSAVLGIALALLITALSGFLHLLHQPPALLAQTKSFLLLLTWSIVPMYLFQILKQYGEALHAAWPPMIILTVGVFLNIALNWVFIFGHFGAPALGLIGAGWATLITRTVTFAALAVVIYRVHLRPPDLKHALFHGSFQWQGYKTLLGLGLPAGCQVLLETIAFTFAAIMMGWISDAALAAHQVALSVASTTFMVPLGLSMAVAIRVSHAIASHDPRRARLCARGSLMMSLSFMGTMAVVICTCAHALAALFIRDPAVMLLATRVLFVAGLFQVFDGTQIVCAGALRGLHDIKIPTLINFSGYWLIGLPVSYLLAFHWHVGAVGVWIGLLVGMLLVSIFFFLRLRSMLNKTKPGAFTDSSG